MTCSCCEEIHTPATRPNMDSGRDPPFMIDCRNQASTPMTQDPGGEQSTRLVVAMPTAPRPMDPSHTLTFRVTGAASIARLEPLLLGRDYEGCRRVVWSRAASNAGGGDAGGSLDFVWETTATKEQRKQHRSARVLNRLSGAQVLEDKANLALLQRLMTVPTLESHVVKGRVAVICWARLHFGRRAEDHPPPLPSADTPFQGAPWQGATPSVAATEPAGASAVGGENWWCVKAAGGNGGMDIWVLHKGNWRTVTERLRDGEDYVIQRYVARPMLWRGRKFHFRCYATVSGDMSAWLYRTAYILCASRPYSLCTGEGEASVGGQAGLADDLTHISNLAANKHTSGHPGQVPCDLPAEYPLLWPRMLEMVRSLVGAATPFMQHQTRAEHFEFLGLDVIADGSGGVWLMEANRLPGLQSSKQNLEEENMVYDRMMLDLFGLLVLPPLTGCAPNPGLFEAVAPPAVDARAPSTETWRNVVRFAAFKRVCKR